MSNEGDGRLRRIPMTDNLVMSEAQLETRLERARNSGKLEFVRELFGGTGSEKIFGQLLLHNYIEVRTHVRKMATLEENGAIPEEYKGWGVVKSLFEQIERRFKSLGVTFDGEVGDSVKFNPIEHRSTDIRNESGEPAIIKTPGIRFLGKIIAQPVVRSTESR